MATLIAMPQRRLITERLLTVIAKYWYRQERMLVKSN